MFEVYIHVPFCLRRCGYCDFNTYTATDLGAGASRGNYANMVIREMKLTKQWQLDHGIEEPPVSTVFFGGGTPTILAARDLVAMLDAVRKIWSIAPDAEITTEANPDTVNEYYINELAAGGFTRVSFGMQSAVPHVLKTLDRTHTPANVAVGVNAANKAGLRSSVDLIYGAPGESLDDWRTSVTTAIDLGVNHISAYALTVEPTTKMGRQIAAGTLPKPNDDDEAAKYEIADDLFAAAGLEWYEVSNWARPGYESQHNLGYWRNVDWAGLGPGAHSHYNAVTEADHPQSASLTAPAGGSKSEAIASASADRTGQRRTRYDQRAWEQLPRNSCPRWRGLSGGCRTGGGFCLTRSAQLGHRAPAFVGHGHQARTVCRGPIARRSLPRKTSKSSSCSGCACTRALTSTASTAPSTMRV